MRLVIAQILNRWLFKQQADKIGVPRRRIVGESLVTAFKGIVFVSEVRSRATAYFTE
jgi:hypothetical protein